jgi:hypothetical protein
MATGLEIHIDAKPVIDAMDRLVSGGHGSVLSVRLHEASDATATAIVREAKARAARRTGRFVESIRKEADREGNGFIVASFLEPEASISWHTMTKAGRSHTQAVTRDNLPLWLEFGTKYMTAKPAIAPAAELETSAHRRRIEEAVQAAIDEVFS